MDALLYHRELQDGDFPDCCVRCGADETELTPLVLSTSIPLTGGPFQYSEVALPMCPEHVRAPIVSLSYPGVREFTADGIVVKNLSEEFVEALKEYRDIKRRRRQERGEPEPPRSVVRPTEQAPLSPERQRAYRMFIVGCIAAALLGGAAIGGIVLLVVPPQKQVPQQAAPQNPRPQNPPMGGPAQRGGQPGDGLIGPLDQKPPGPQRGRLGPP